VRFKVIFKSALAGIAAAIVSCFVLNSPVTRAALVIRQRMPEAWFSSSVVLYAIAVVLVCSIAIGSLVFRIAYKRAIRSAALNA